jgi:putative lipase involved disintegration of autophagic bodies
MNVLRSCCRARIAVQLAALALATLTSFVCEPDSIEEMADRRRTSAYLSAVPPEL